MYSYYCVKENLCEVMFSVIRTPKLFPKREHFIRRYYTPPHHPYPSRDCSTRNSLDVSLTPSEELRLRMCRNQNESTYLQGNMIGRFAIDIVS